MAADQQPAIPTMQQWYEVIVPDRFSGQTVIVTGAGSGIGRAVASRVAREGGRVIGCDVSAERLRELSDTAGDAAGDIVNVTGDVSREEDVAAIVDAAGAIVDAWANVAGIMDDFTPIGEVSDEVFERVMRVNVTGVVRLTRAVIAPMLASGGGSIVNVSSGAGLRGSAAGVAYTMSKHAVNGRTRSTAIMYGADGIRCNAVCPGATITNIEANFASQHAMQRLGPYMQTNVGMPAQATQVAATICFLLSRDGANVNGALLPSDGGWNAV